MKSRHTVRSDAQWELIAPMMPDSTGKAGGRPVTYDREAYTRRNVVECSFNTLKQWRPLTTRYDKQALTYRTAVALQAVVHLERGNCHIGRHALDQSVMFLGCTLQRLGLWALGYRHFLKFISPLHSTYSARRYETSPMPPTHA